MKNNKVQNLINVDGIQNNASQEDMLDFLQQQKAIIINLKQGFSAKDESKLKFDCKNIIGVELNILYEILFYLGLIKANNKTLQGLKEKILTNGYSIKNIIAAYPNLNNPRFILPFTGKHSHRFLFLSLFFPRRYSLNLANRVVLRVYCWLFGLLSNPAIIHRNSFLIIDKNEDIN